ncbi:MAG: TonB-dependent receptor [Alphaproteobacteria bacterium]
MNRINKTPSVGFRDGATREGRERPVPSSRLMLCLSAAVLALGVSATAHDAHAQTVDATDEAADDTVVEVEEGLERMVVFGTGLAQQRAIETKRNTLQIVDALSEDDIGRLPDLNVAAALRRVPGLAIQNDQGEARFPVIRGLNAEFNRVTIDGATVASPERGTRTVPLDIIPASLLAGLEVVKTITPDLDPNALGGTINLRTRSAFDREEDQFFFGQFFGGIHGQAGEGGTLFSEEPDREIPFRVNVAGGKRFGPGEQFGVVVGFDYSRRNFEIPQIEVDDADYTEFDADGNNVGLGNGNGIVVPTNNRVFFYNNLRERISGHGRVEWRPSETFAVDLRGLYARFTDDERRDEFRYELGTNAGRGQPATILEQTPVSGITETGFGIVGLGRFEIDRTIYVAAGTMEWAPVDGLTWTVDLSYSGAGLTNPESTESFQSDTSFGAFYDTSTFFPRTVPLDPAAFFDPASFAHSNRGELDRSTDEDIFEARSDVLFETDVFPIETTVKVGGLYRNRQREEETIFNRFRPTADLGYTLADAFNRDLASVEFQGGYDFPFRVDDLGATDFFQANEGAFTRDGAPGAPTFFARSEAEEDIVAGYVMATVSQGPFTLTGGVRIEYTEWEGLDVPSGTGTSGDYTNVLPAVLGRWDILENLTLRAAYTETIGRPDLSDLTRATSITQEPDGSFIVSRSNPDLDPRQARNLDLSVEWYIPDGIIAAGVFYKDVKDEIFVLTTQDAVFEGAPAVITQPINAEDAEIFGIEFQAQQVLTWLPSPFDNFGFNVNVTWLDTEFTVPTATGTRTTGFFQQPDVVANATLFYAVEDLEVRASYNYTGDFIDTIVANDPLRDEFWTDRAQVDLQVRYNLTDQLTFIFEGQNLNNEGRTEVTGPNQAFLQESAEFGRTFWFGISAAL